MPTFFFHICDGAGFCEDEDGRDLPDLAAAKKEAIRGLRDLVAGDVQAGQLNLTSFVEIEDENHNLLATLFLEDVLRISKEDTQRQRPRRS